MTDRCEPPPEHQHHIYHWLEHNGKHHIAEFFFMSYGARSQPLWRLVDFPISYAPKEMAKHGYRYIGPCVPPEVSDG